MTHTLILHGGTQAAILSRPMTAMRYLPGGEYASSLSHIPLCACEGVAGPVVKYSCMYTGIQCP